MADVFPKPKRSEIMSHIGQKNTRPEILVRKMLHKLGYRFRLHRKDLPGTPDIVLPRYKSVVFVHGCFWHGHDDCSRATLPETNKEFWEKKVRKNRERDQLALKELQESGWQYLVVWQCQLRDQATLESTLKQFLSHKR